MLFLCKEKERNIYVQLYLTYMCKLMRISIYYLSVISIKYDYRLRTGYKTLTMYKIQTTRNNRLRIKHGLGLKHELQTVVVKTALER